ncbi:hypothetical protein V8E36_006191 [Tilletia maclaganii]
MTSGGPGVFRNLGERVFDSHPQTFSLLESELASFLAEENAYARFLKPHNKNAQQKSRAKEGSRRYTRQPSKFYEATFVSHCSCSKVYRDRRDEDLSPVRRRVTGLAERSYKASDSGPADETFDSPLHGPPREDSLLGITYHWKHENHDPGSLPDLARQRNCGAVREWIEMQVQQGKSVSEIMRAVRMSLPDLQKTLVATTTIDASIRIRYNDVYNVVRRLKIERARKDPEGQQSCQLWVQELEKEGWDARMLESFEPGGPAGARSSAWAIFLLSQAGKEILRETDSSVWCLDSTHNTGYGFVRSQKIFLTTIITRSTATGTGFPSAFMITPSETQ